MTQDNVEEVIASIQAMHERALACGASVNLLTYEVTFTMAQLIRFANSAKNETVAKTIRSHRDWKNGDILRVTSNCEFPEGTLVTHCDVDGNDVPWVLPVDTSCGKEEIAVYATDLEWVSRG